MQVVAVILQGLPEAVAIEDVVASCMVDDSEPAPPLECLRDSHTSRAVIRCPPTAANRILSAWNGARAGKDGVVSATLVPAQPKDALDDLLSRYTAGVLASMRGRRARLNAQAIGTLSFDTNVLTEMDLFELLMCLPDVQRKAIFKQKTASSILAALDSSNLLPGELDVLCGEACSLDDHGNRILGFLRTQPVPPLCLDSPEASLDATLKAQKLVLDAHYAGFGKRSKKDYTKTVPLRFHTVHGQSIALSRRGSCATRLGGYSNGLCFSHVPLASVDGTRSFEIRIERQTQIVAGVLIVGVTTADPTTLDEVPNTALKLAQSWLLHGSNIVQDGRVLGNYAPEQNGMYGLGTGAIIKVVLNRQGRLKFIFNGIDMGFATGGLPPNCPVYAVVDVLGRTERVSFSGQRSRGTPPPSADGSPCASPARGSPLGAPLAVNVPQMTATWAIEMLLSLSDAAFANEPGCLPSACHTTLKALQGLAPFSLSSLEIGDVLSDSTLASFEALLEKLSLAATRHPDADRLGLVTLEMRALFAIARGRLADLMGLLDIFARADVDPEGRVSLGNSLNLLSKCLDHFSESAPQSPEQMTTAEFHAGLISFLQQAFKPPSAGSDGTTVKALHMARYADSVRVSKNLVEQRTAGKVGTAQSDSPLTVSMPFFEAEVIALNPKTPLMIGVTTAEVSLDSCPDNTQSYILLSCSCGSVFSHTQQPLRTKARALSASIQVGDRIGCGMKFDSSGDFTGWVTFSVNGVAVSLGQFSEPLSGSFPTVILGEGNVVQMGRWNRWPGQLSFLPGLNPDDKMAAESSCPDEKPDPIRRLVSTGKFTSAELVTCLPQFWRAYTALLSKQHCGLFSLSTAARGKRQVALLQLLHRLLSLAPSPDELVDEGQGRAPGAGSPLNLTYAKMYNHFKAVCASIEDPPSPGVAAPPPVPVPCVTVTEEDRPVLSARPSFNLDVVYVVDPAQAERCKALATDILTEGMSRFLVSTDLKLDMLGELVQRQEDGSAFAGLCQYFTQEWPKGVFRLPHLSAREQQRYASQQLRLVNTLIYAAADEMLLPEADEITPAWLASLRAMGPSRSVEALLGVQANFFQWLAFAQKSLGKMDKDAGTVAQMLRDSVTSYVRIVNEFCSDSLLSFRNAVEVLREGAEGPSDESAPNGLVVGLADALRHSYVARLLPRLLLLLEAHIEIAEVQEALIPFLAQAKEQVDCIDALVRGCLDPPATPSPGEPEQPQDPHIEHKLCAWKRNSSHPYGSGANMREQFECPGATHFLVQFDPRCETEEGFDKLEIATDLCGSNVFSGKWGSATWPQEIVLPSCGSLQLSFSSDGSKQRWGYAMKISAVFRVPGAGAAAVPWLLHSRRLLARFLGLLLGTAMTRTSQPSREHVQAIRSRSTSPAISAMRTPTPTGDAFNLARADAGAALSLSAEVQDMHCQRLKILMRTEIWSNLLRGGVVQPGLVRSLSGRHTSDAQVQDVMTFLQQIVDDIDEGAVLTRQCRAARRLPKVGLGGPSLNAAVRALFAAVLYQCSVASAAAHCIYSLDPGAEHVDIPAEVLFAFDAAESFRMPMMRKRQIVRAALTPTPPPNNGPQSPAPNPSDQLGSATPVQFQGLSPEHGSGAAASVPKSEAHIARCYDRSLFLLRVQPVHGEPRAAASKVDVAASAKLVKAFVSSEELPPLDLLSDFLLDRQDLAKFRALVMDTFVGLQGHDDGSKLKAGEATSPVDVPHMTESPRGDAGAEPEAQAMLLVRAFGEGLRKGAPPAQLDDEWQPVAGSAPDDGHHFTASLEGCGIQLENRVRTAFYSLLTAFVRRVRLSAPMLRGFVAALGTEGGGAPTERHRVGTSAVLAATYSLEVRWHPNDLPHLNECGLMPALLELVTAIAASEDVEARTYGANGDDSHACDAKRAVQRRGAYRDTLALLSSRAWGAYAAAVLLAAGIVRQRDPEYGEVAAAFCATAIGRCSAILSREGQPGACGVSRLFQQALGLVCSLASTLAPVPAPGVRSACSSLCERALAAAGSPYLAGLVALTLGRVAAGCAAVSSHAEGQGGLSGETAGKVQSVLNLLFVLGSAAFEGGTVELACLSACAYGALLRSPTAAVRGCTRAHLAERLDGSPDLGSPMGMFLVTAAAGLPDLLTPGSVFVDPTGPTGGTQALFLLGYRWPFTACRLTTAARTIVVRPASSLRPLSPAEVPGACGGTDCVMAAEEVVEHFGPLLGGDFSEAPPLVQCAVLKLLRDAVGAPRGQPLPAALLKGDALKNVMYTAMLATGQSRVWKAAHLEVLSLLSRSTYIPAVLACPEPIPYRNVSNKFFLRVREKPSLKSTVVGRIRHDEMVLVVGHKGDWCQLRGSGKGWRSKVNGVCENGWALCIATDKCEIDHVMLVPNEPQHVLPLRREDATVAVVLPQTATAVAAGVDLPSLARPILAALAGGLQPEPIAEDYVFESPHPIPLGYVVKGAVTIPSARRIRIEFDPMCWSDNVRLLAGADSAGGKGRGARHGAGQGPRARAKKDSPSKLDAERKKSVFNTLFNADEEEDTPLAALEHLRANELGLTVAFLGKNGSVVVVGGSSPWDSLEFEGHTVRYVCISRQLEDSPPHVKETWGFRFRAHVMDGCFIGGYDPSVQTVEAIKQALPKPFNAQGPQTVESVLSGLQHVPQHPEPDTLPSSLFLLQAKLADPMSEAMSSLYGNGATVLHARDVMAALLRHWPEPTAGPGPKAPGLDLNFLGPSSCSILISFLHAAVSQCGRAAAQDCIHSVVRIATPAQVTQLFKFGIDTLESVGRITIQREGPTFYSKGTSTFSDFVQLPGAASLAIRVVNDGRQERWDSLTVSAMMSMSKETHTFNDPSLQAPLVVHGDRIYLRFGPKKEGWTGRTEPWRFSITGDTQGVSETGIRVLSTIVDWVGQVCLPSKEADGSRDGALFPAPTLGAADLFSLDEDAVVRPLGTPSALDEQTALSIFSDAWPRLLHTCASLSGHTLLNVIQILTKMLSVWSRSPHADVDLRMTSGLWRIYRKVYTSGNGTHSHASSQFLRVMSRFFFVVENHALAVGRTGDLMVSTFSRMHKRAQRSQLDGAAETSSSSESEELSSEEDDTTSNSDTTAGRPWAYDFTFNSDEEDDELGPISFEPELDGGAGAGASGDMQGEELAMYLDLVHRGFSLDHDLDSGSDTDEHAQHGAELVSGAEEGADGESEGESDLDSLEYDDLDGLSFADLDQDVVAAIIAEEAAADAAAEAEGSAAGAEASAFASFAEPEPPASEPDSLGDSSTTANPGSPTRRSTVV